MMDTSLTGRRCRATKEIRSYRGLTKRFTEGTIQYDFDNIGRHLFSVAWDNGVIDYAFPFEIEIIDEEEESFSLNEKETGHELVELDEEEQRIVIYKDVTWN